MSLLVSFILVLAALVIGEIISTKTKAIIPSVFITAVTFFSGILDNISSRYHC